jgi:hypothetical protein
MPNAAPAPTADHADQQAAAAFIQRWQGTTASELSTAQSFVTQLCALLDVPAPHPTQALDYMFERPITFAHGDGSSSAGRIDCYKHGHFVLEAKKTRLNANTKGFDDALLRARAQGEGYARALPAQEGRPPFVLVVDVGTVIELYSEFTRSGATYVPFPDPRSHRIALSDLAKPDIRQRLKLIWTDPLALDPSRLSASTTRDVAGQLAELAKSLEQSGHRANHVAAFLTRSLFSMFAEDVELLPKGSFLKLLQDHQANPPALQGMLRALWMDMDQGGFSAALSAQVLKFNGKLFKEPTKDGYSLLLNTQQIAQLSRAAQANWREVEPAIFGTLLERALSPTERHALGAHYTPRAYVERLVLPTVVEPLRTDWANAQAAAVLLASEAAELTGKPHDDKMAQARAELKQFHHQLCTLKVLDPACGSGNFLYVTLEHLKRLEGEVMNQLEAFGQTQSTLGLEGETVTPQQLLGIELNDRAAALAELVLWIGYLQWHIRTRGNKAVAEPVVHDYGNIECRDAVLAWADTDLAYDPDGQLLSRWDGKTFKTHPVTGSQVPDETALVPQWRYVRPTQAKWPTADFIVGNPPFIGASTLRAALGDGYVEALRKTWPEVPESADFVMHWWARSALMVSSGTTRQFGLITTNSLRQTFNRRVVQAALDKNLQLTYAIPDHPWVDSANGAAVRIAMTVGTRAAAANLGSDPRPKAAGSDPNFAEQSAPARLLTLLSETTGDFGEVDVVLVEHGGVIHADLSVGANVASAVALESNANISSPGVKLHGAGFIVTADEAAAFKLQGSQTIIRDYRNGRDLTGEPRDVKVIDAFGLSAEELRTLYPSIYQRLYDHVKPEREQNNRATYRDNWWIFGESRRELRPALKGLPRYIATVETAKHRTFQFLDAGILPDNMLIAIASKHAFDLGVLSSNVHITWALAQGGTLEDRPRYNKSRCFETFPFPAEGTGLTPERRNHIITLAEQIDAHRKRQQVAHPGLTLTGMYNVLEALKAGRELTAKEKIIHTQGLVGILKELHDELDVAVLQAYGWSDLTLRQAQGERGSDELLTRLVALNAERAAEEKTGKVRWLRPEFQNPAFKASQQTLSKQELLAPGFIGLQANLIPENDQKPTKTGKNDLKTSPNPWPSTLPAQVSAIAQLLASASAALSLPDIEASFKGKGPWKKGLPRILETLEALGRARREETRGIEGWRAL